MKTVYRTDHKGYIYGFKVPENDNTEYEDHVVCQSYYWLPSGKLNPIAMEPTAPFLPRVLNGEIFDFYEEQMSFVVPAILEVGDRGFFFAEVVYFEGKRSFAVDGRFVIPSDWNKHEFFLQLFTFLVAGHDPDSREAFGLYFEDNGDPELIFKCRSLGDFITIGSFPKDYLIPMVPFLEKTFSYPLYNFDYSTGSLKAKQF